MFRLDDKVRVKKVIWDKTYPNIDNIEWHKIVEIYNDRYCLLSNNDGIWWDMQTLLPIPSCKDLEIKLCSLCEINMLDKFRYTYKLECCCSFFIDTYSRNSKGIKEDAIRVKNTFLYDLEDNNEMKRCFVAVLKKFYPAYYDIIEPYVTLV